MKSIILAFFAVIMAIGSATADVSPEAIAGAETVNVDQAAALFDAGAIFVDVRKASDFDAGRVPGAVHLDVKSAFTEATLSAAVAKDQEVVIYCNGHSCMRSSKASAQAVEWGFVKVRYLRDGYPAWEAAGLPVE